MSPEAELWGTIQDIIGNASLWPRRIRRLFWTKNITHWNRILVCLFVYTNGLNPEFFYEWAQIRGMCSDNSARRELHSLLSAFERDPKKYNWYAYNVSHNRYETLAGKPVRY